MEEYGEPDSQLGTRNSPVYYLFESQMKNISAYLMFLVISCRAACAKSSHAVAMRF